MKSKKIQSQNDFLYFDFFQSQHSNFEQPKKEALRLDFRASKKEENIFSFEKNLEKIFFRKFFEKN